MKGWISAALAVTFLSGASTGILIDRSVAPPPAPKGFVDNWVEHLEREGVNRPEDLEKARAILVDWETQLRAERTKVEEFLRDRLDHLNDELERGLNEIRAKYGIVKQDGR